MCPVRLDWERILGLEDCSWFLPGFVPCIFSLADGTLYPFARLNHSLDT